MRRSTIFFMALILLIGVQILACSQENPLGFAVSQLFKDPKQYQEVSYNAWKTARDEGPHVALVKSSNLVQKASALAEENAVKAAPFAFAAWWYNIAAQYWSEVAAQKPGGENLKTAIERIVKARRDLEMALGWDTAEAGRFQKQAYESMNTYK